MRRDRNSLFALPVDQYFPEVNAKHPNVKDRFTSHSNLLLATPTQVVQGIIAKERFELEEQYPEDIQEKDEPEACFIEEALQYLSQRESGIDIPKERFELEDQYRAEKDEPEACFIEEALQYLSQRESGIELIHEESITEDIEEDNQSSDS